jgi:hypothetical protein
MSRRLADCGSVLRSTPFEKSRERRCPNVGSPARVTCHDRAAQRSLVLAPLGASPSNFLLMNGSNSASGCVCIWKAKSAEKSGMGMMDEEAIEIAMKLPPEFVALSLDTHQKFDALGLEAARGGTKIGALKQLDEILANCTACHATFRLSSR